MGRRLALLIASYEYQDAGLRQLTAPAHDTEALAAVLQDPDVAGFEVTTLINEPHHRVGEAIGDLYRDRRRDDLTLLYFTGHGLKDDDGRLYLAMTNTQRGSLLFTSLPAEQIDQAMTDCMSRQKVLILDCCYSGAFPAGRIAKADAAVHALERFQGRGRTVLTASDAMQYSFEGDRPHGSAAQSVFTRHLVAGLRDGSADLDGDGNITIDELYSYVHDRVVEELPQQRPKRQDNVEGRIVIARNINWSLPSYLRSALDSPIATDRLSAVNGLAHLYRIGNDLVRAQVTAEVRRLAEDDSRAVSAAASDRLREFLPESAENPGVSRSTSPATPADEASTTSPSEADPVRAAPPVSAVPAPALAPTRQTGHFAQIRKDVAALGTHLLRRSRNQARHLRNQARSLGLVGVSGVFSLLAAGLLVTGIVQSALGDGFPAGAWMGAPWYVIAMAAVALAAGVCALTPRTRTSAGPGVVLGTAVASAWGLVYFALGARVSWTYWATLWSQLAGHLALALAAVIAGVVVWRSHAVQLGFRIPSGLRAWSMIVLASLAVLISVVALAGALYQTGHLQQDHDNLWLDNLAWSYLVAVPAAAGVPVLAAVTAPRRFGLSLLGGWAAGACAIALGTYQWVRSYESGFIAVGAGTLLVLSTAWAISPRWSVTTRAVHWRRRYLIAALAAGPLLATSGAVVIDRGVRSPVIEALPIGMVVSPDGARLYVTTANKPSDAPVWAIAEMPGHVTVLATGTNKAMGKPIPVGNPTPHIAVSRDGGYVYAANRTGSVSVISTLENKTVGKPIPVGGRPLGMRVTSDGRRLLVVSTAGLSIIDTATNSSTGSPIPLGTDIQRAVPSPDGQRLYVTSDKSGAVSVLDTTTGKAIGGPLTLGKNIGPMVISPDGRRLYVDAEDSLVVVDAMNNKTVGQIVRLDNGPRSGMAMSADGRRIYVSDAFAQSVTVIDTTAIATVGAPIKIGGTPGAITVSPDNRVYIAHILNSKIAMFKADNPDAVRTIDIGTR